MADDIEYYLKRGESLRSDRSNFESMWDATSRLLDPAFNGAFLSRNTYNASRGEEGQRKDEHAYDAGPIIACERFTSVMESLMTPQNSYWGKLTPVDKTLKKNKAALEWFENVNRLLFEYRYAPRANFVNASQRCYGSLGRYGNGTVFVEEASREPGLKYRSPHLSETYFVIDSAGIVTGMYRYFNLKAWEVVREYENVPDSIREKANNPMMRDEKVQVLHVIEEREGYDPELIGPEGMPYKSCYILPETRHKLDEGGYRSFPYAVARYSTGEDYGRGPAQMVLPALKVLNQQKKDMLIESRRILRPVLLAHDDSRLATATLKAGKLVAGGLNKDGRRMIDTLPTGNLRVGKEAMDDERGVISDAFLLTLFQILVESPQMTATEVLERAREKGMLIAPTAGRLQGYFLGAMIEREIDLLMAQGLIPPPPPILQDPDALYYTIEFNSPLSRMRDAELASGYMRTFDYLTQKAAETGNPDFLDWLDTDEGSKLVARVNGTPEELLRADEVVEQIRAARSQQMQEQRQLEAAPAMTGLVKAAQGMQQQ